MLEITVSLLNKCKDDKTEKIVETIFYKIDDHYYQEDQEEENIAKNKKVFKSEDPEHVYVNEKHSRKENCFLVQTGNNDIMLIIN